MADVSQIRIAPNSVFDLKDSTARRLASTSQTGQVKPDGSTITIDQDGTIHSAGGSSGGHKILNSSGTEMTQRSKLQFANSTVTDDSTNDKTIVMPNNILTTTVDPGEGSPLATNNLLIVVEE